MLFVVMVVCWLAQREAVDVEMERLLCELEEGLGPWGRAMLLGPPTEARLQEAVERAAVAISEQQEAAGLGEALRVGLAGVGHEAEVEELLQQAGLRPQLAEEVTRLLQPLLTAQDQPDSQQEGREGQGQGERGSRGGGKRGVVGARGSSDSWRAPA